MSDSGHRLARRDSFEEVLKSKIAISRIEYVKDILSAMSSVVCILNRKNQVVFSNDIMLEKYELNLGKNILGIRPGEIFNCVNSYNDTGGCGTSEKCKYCGANTAFDLAWEKSVQVKQECKITSKAGGQICQLDLEITATPFHFEDEYLIVSINDITEKKRKELLERIFFHDIMNIAGSLSGVIEFIPMLDKSEREEYFNIASSLTSQIIDEIKAQQEMVKAEKGELRTYIRPVKISEFLCKLADQVRFHNVSTEKQIDILNQTETTEIQTDETLLTRVLINMVKNAMEAVVAGERIVLKAEQLGNNIRFSVHNNSFIPKDIQLQIFQRSYSTKGKNRGMGTYSMKLLGERYLKGEVGFTSTKSTGTIFFIDLPIIKISY